MHWYEETNPAKISWVLTYAVIDYVDLIVDC